MIDVFSMLNDFSNHIYQHSQDRNLLVEVVLSSPCFATLDFLLHGRGPKHGKGTKYGHA